MKLFPKKVSCSFSLASALWMNCRGLIELSGTPAQRGTEGVLFRFKMLCFCFSPLLVFLKDPSCSHLMQTVFSCSHKTVLRDVYRSHLRTHLMPLTLHPIANYTVQSLISASARFRVVRPCSGSSGSLTRLALNISQTCKYINVSRVTL